MSFDSKKMYGVNQGPGGYFKEKKPEVNISCKCSSKAVRGGRQVCSAKSIFRNKVEK